MKKHFITLLFLIVNNSHTIFCMAFDDFVQRLENLHLQNATIDRDIITEHDEANVLLQLSAEENSSRSINHLARALTIIKRNYPDIRSFKINKGKWPVTIIRLSVSDHQQNDAYPQIINIIDNNNGLPLSVEDCIQKFQTIFLTFAFPKKIAIYQPVKYLAEKISPEKITMQVYPSNCDDPLEHIRLKKDKNKNCYYLNYTRKDSFFPDQQEITITYDYHSGSPSINHTIKEKGTLNSLQ